MDDQQFRQKFFHKLYNMSVSIFIIGIMGVAHEWEYGPDIMIVGGVPLVIIYFFRSFGSPESN